MNKVLLVIASILLAMPLRAQAAPSVADALSAIAVDAPPALASLNALALDTQARSYYALIGQPAPASRVSQPIASLLTDYQNAVLALNAQLGALSTTVSGLQTQVAALQMPMGGVTVTTSGGGGFAAITFVQSQAVGADNATHEVITFPGNVTAGNTIIVTIGSYYTDAANPGQAFTVTDNNGNTYHQDVYFSDTAGQEMTFHAENVVAGATTVNVSSSIAAYFASQAMEYSGLATSGAFDASSTGSCASPCTTYTSNAVTPAQANELLVGGHFTYATAPTITPTNSFALESSSTDSFVKAWEQDRIVSSTASYASTGSITGDATKVMSTIATFKAAAR